MADVSLAVEPVTAQATETSLRRDVSETKEMTVTDKAHTSPPKGPQSKGAASTGGSNSSGPSSPAKPKTSAKLSPPRYGPGGVGKAPSPKKNPWSKRPHQSPPSAAGSDEKKKTHSVTTEGKAPPSSSAREKTTTALPSKSIKIPRDEVRVHVKWGSPLVGAVTSSCVRGDGVLTDCLGFVVIALVCPHLAFVPTFL